MYSTLTLVLLLIGSKAFLFPSGSGEVVPKNPCVYVGDMLYLNCTSGEEDEETGMYFEYFKYSVSDGCKYFRIPDDFTHRISANLLSLRLPVDTVDYDTYFYCYQSDGNGGRIPKGDVDVEVAVRPDPITRDSITAVSNNFQDMLVDFCPTEYKDYFSWNVTWEAGLGGILNGPTVYLDNIIRCRIYFCGKDNDILPPGWTGSSELCTGKTGMFSQSLEYTLTITTTPYNSAFDDVFVSTVEVKASRDIVKPYPIRDLMFINRTDGEDGFNITWGKPKDWAENFLDLNYSVKVTSKSQKLDEEYMIGPTLDPELFLFLDVSEGESFQVSVQAAVDGAMYWSDSQYITHTVDETEPEDDLPPSIDPLILGLSIGISALVVIILFSVTVVRYARKKSKDLDNHYEPNLDFTEDGPQLDFGTQGPYNENMIHESQETNHDIIASESISTQNETITTSSGYEDMRASDEHVGALNRNTSGDYANEFVNSSGKHPYDTSGHDLESGASWQSDLGMGPDGVGINAIATTTNIAIKDVIAPNDDDKEDDDIQGQQSPTTSNQDGVTMATSGSVASYSKMGRHINTAGSLDIVPPESINLVPLTHNIVTGGVSYEKEPTAIKQCFNGDTDDAKGQYDLVKRENESLTKPDYGINNELLNSNSSEYMATSSSENTDRTIVIALPTQNSSISTTATHKNDPSRKGQMNPQHDTNECLQMRNNDSGVDVGDMVASDSNGHNKPWLKQSQPKIGIKPQISRDSGTAETLAEDSDYFCIARAESHDENSSDYNNYETNNSSAGGWDPALPPLEIIHMVTDTEESNI